MCFVSVIVITSSKAENCGFFNLYIFTYKPQQPNYSKQVEKGCAQLISIHVVIDKQIVPSQISLAYACIRINLVYPT